MTLAPDYVPGVCNIGSAEIGRKRVGGTAALLATLAFWVVLLAIDAAPGWHLLLFFPAFAAAVGLGQAIRHFCIYFGFAAMFNFGRLGDERAVTTRAAIAADHRAALRLLGVSAIIAAGVALLAFGGAFLV